MNESRFFPDVFRRKVEAGRHEAAASPSLALAKRADFRLGDATVRPSVRTVEGPGGSTAAEPRVMQVLVALADADGGVLTRDDLIRLCWKGQVVGDDSINRAIAEVRRIARETVAGFGVETIPRIGYRLTGVAPAGAKSRVTASPATGPIRLLTRRRLLVGGAAAATTGAFGAWVMYRDRADPRVAALIERSRQALRDELPDSNEQGVGFLRQAVAIDPDNAEAWGLLALALRNAAENASPAETTAAVHACETAARRALSLDRGEGNALAALATLRPSFGDWIAAEDALRGVLAIAPNNVAAMSHLVTLLQSVGRARASWTLSERVVALEPLSPVHQFRRALKLWIFGRLAQADIAVDRALQLWPRHPGVWNARMMIFAFSGRPRAGLAMLGDDRIHPSTFTPQSKLLWRVSLVALDTRAPSDVAAARDAILRAAPHSPTFVVGAIMVLSALGELDATFAVTDGYLLRRGPLIGTLWTGRDEMPVNDMRWRRTMNLFTPATAAMRADPRFLELCEGIGIADYWRRRGVGPDPFLLRLGEDDHA